MYQYNMYGQLIPKRKSEREIQIMIDFVMDCLEDRRGWIHTVMRDIVCDRHTYRCPTCHETVHGQDYCWRCYSYLSRGDLIHTIPTSFGDVFENMALSTNKSTYNKLRKYLQDLFNREIVSSYTLRPHRLTVKWFKPHARKVVEYFGTFQYKYCPDGSERADSNDIGVPMGIIDEETGKYLTNPDPFHWLPNWRDEQKEAERAKTVRLEREGRDMDGKMISDARKIKRLRKRIKITL